jgi:hypothetical protein
MFTGCLDAAKTFRDTHMSSELWDDGSRKEIRYTPKIREEAFLRIKNKANQDGMYNAGVEAALIWKLKILKDVSEISLEEVPDDSSIRNCLKDKKLTRVTVAELVSEVSGTTEI